MASTKEQISAQAMGSFKTVEVDIGSAKAVLRELPQAERRALDESSYQMKDGEFVEDKDGFLVPINPKFFYERWIAATITPAFTVEEIAPWPVSLKKRLCDAAKLVNNIEPAATVAKNS